MSVYAVYKCDGCDAVSDETLLGSEFKSITGKSYGFGRRLFKHAHDSAPEGWIAYDMIGCTYCPKCANELEEDNDE